MKTSGIILTFIGAVSILLSIIFGVLCHYNYSKNLGSYWELADKASSIPQKTIYMDKFVGALESAGMEGNHDAIILQTPDNSYDQNHVALKSLQVRLHEIQTMDVQSFQYQTAIQQITAQEQGEAKGMLDTFKGIWIKTHYFLLWDWVCVTQVILSIIILVGGIIFWNWENLTE